jgi:hypothetical protein
VGELAPPLRFRQRWACALIALGVLFSAPFAFYSKSDVLAALALLGLMLGLALAGRVAKVQLRNVVPHLAGCIAAAALFAYHGLDLLYIKFMLALVISFQLTMVDWAVLQTLRKHALYYGSRGAVLAIFSFVLYFSSGSEPFFRTLLADGRSIPFFGLTNINFGFENPELLIFARPAFLFDEPGQFAHAVLLLLALIGLSTAAARKQWSLEVRLLVFAGLATFSVAFVVITIIYLASKAYRPSTWIWIVAIGVAAIALAQHPLMDTLLSRLNVAETISGEQVWTADNRSHEVRMAYAAFISNPMWGAGWTHAEATIGHFAANALGPFGYSGLMAIPLYLPLVLRLYRCWRAALHFEHMLIIALLTLFFAQRPYFYFPLFMLLMEVILREMEINAAKANDSRIDSQRQSVQSHVNDGEAHPAGS